MLKKFELGNVDYRRVGKKLYMVEVEIELIKAFNGDPMFSARGRIWNSKHTDIICNCKRLDIINYFKDDFTKENRELFEKIYNAIQDKDLKVINELLNSDKEEIICQQIVQ